MTITNLFTTGCSTDQFSEYTSLLFYLAKKGASTPSERISKVAQMTNAYVEFREDRPHYTQLDRLASLILRDDLIDKHPDKMTRNEYPIMSASQREEREKGETSMKWAESIAIDGRDYQPKTHDYMRKLREISV